MESDSDHESVNISDEESVEELNETDSDDEPADTFHGLKTTTITQTPPETRVRNVIITENDRKTSSKITRFEITQLIGIRATHINNNAPIYVKIPTSSGISARDIAILELKQRRCPLLIRRPYGQPIINKTDNGFIERIEYYEEWDPNEMEIPKTFLD